MKQYFCLGSYTEPILFGTGQVFEGKGEGITLCEFDDGRIRKIGSLPVRNPSFLCVDELFRRIYAVNEGKEFLGAEGGGITEVSLDASGRMKQENAFNDGGKDPCHIAVSPDRSFLAAANFASGSVTVFGLGKDGSVLPERRIWQHTGKSVHPVRQAGPHAHSVIFSPDGRFLFVPDLGTDTLYAYECRTGASADGTSSGGTAGEADGSEYLVPSPERNVRIAPGSGPRYGEFSPDGKDFYLICEIGCAVEHYRYSCKEGTLEYAGRAGTLPAGFSGENICSDLHLSGDGRFLYASNRGHDSISVYAVGKDGSPEMIQNISCGGKTPRNFALSPDGGYLLCGNQDSDRVTVFQIHEDGMLEEGNSFPSGSPVCIRFFDYSWRSF